MYMYRIAKYNLNSYDENGIFTEAEWTDYSDIGKTFHGETLTEEAYLLVETQYITTAQCLFENTCREEISIANLQKYQSDLPWANHQMIGKTQLAEIMRDCFRNKCWCRLYGENFYIHFGYDFYMYIGCTVPYDEVQKICNANQLYVIEQESPYLTIDGDPTSL